MERKLSTSRPLLRLLVICGSLSYPAPVLSAPENSIPIRTETISVTTVDDSVHTYVSVEPWPGDFIKTMRPDGGLEFLSMHKIRHIRSIGEVDITHRVLVERKRVGSGSEVETKRNKTITFRGYPDPETKWFFILQSGVLVRISGDSNPSHLVIDWGVMRNLGSHWAVGLNLHTQSGDVGGHGLMVRGRRWLSRSISTDLAVGFLDPDEVSPDNSRVWIGQAHLNLGNVASLTMEMQSWKSDYSPYPYYQVYYPGLESGTHTSFNAGGSIGYLPGLVVLGLAVGTIVLIGAAMSY